MSGAPVAKRAREEESAIPELEPVYGAKPDTARALEQYRDLHRVSAEDPDAFWGHHANDILSWFQPFDIVHSGGFEHGDVAWFLNGKLNASYCCLDQHLDSRAEQTAVIWEGDEPGETKSLTYAELHREVCKFANAMKKKGVRKGDVVTIYMPMVVEAMVAMLACARLGAPHAVVFAGFSAEALAQRIEDAHSKWIFTTNEGKRGGRTLQLKAIVDDALHKVADAMGDQNPVQHVFVCKRTDAEVHMTPGRDIDFDALAAGERGYCPAEECDSEDTLFVLYTSGSTGKPKGIAHSTAGYLVYAAMTTKNSFDIREGDRFACVADIGWITGHSYIVYGPLVNGTTTLMFESTPTYPDPGRYWDVVQRHQLTQLYTAPTAIRALMRYGDEPVKKYDRSSLRVLGSVGEPINPEAWRWYYHVVGEGRCTIADTFWQTETGGHLATPLPGITPMKPGSCSFPCYGIDFAVLDPQTGEELTATDEDVEGVLCVRRPWPSVARTIYGDHQRFLNVYMKPYNGFYFTGDGCRRDKDGFYWITGRVDDVLNTSGHRLGTAEVESALVAHASCAEAAVVGMPHDIKGQGICCYVILRAGVEESPELVKELRLAVRTAIGPFATPDMIVPVSGLPKTRSGKIMRRVLRKVAAGEEDQLGDVSTMADSAVVQAIIDAVHKARA
uniref:Acetyl-coenzyme A synthetase n=1 Tax=Phaeomonas parva TaxID=124430 RepID=A0A7S1UH83_9STRA|mmetsp:Transcript_5663/g.15832  ORF Transcript_5663/g.15832 Transcript_5663/m.15832 type:complete len:672 (+) Transcript_5663:127-2142(+)|eukprot:CAMPEP_0118866184 /NCGR_PEP_ID=MMETSP1163-20130328/10190_1 /TAXON_ID=124430 /ORGANISM="Phaeomonas parva, Strain CCMP2877" /LENGTH=671 /DNA_ID=CAMNT_0006800481 /DNA_START=91 /DNA_END=2106 /DNA_ORIENTATION=+